MEEAVKQLFRKPEWVAARVSGRQVWRHDPNSWWGSQAATYINEKVSGALFDENNSAYSLGFDFVNISAFLDYSVGLVYIRSEDRSDEIRSKQRYHVPVIS